MKKLKRGQITPRHAFAAAGLAELKSSGKKKQPTKSRLGTGLSSNLNPLIGGRESSPCPFSGANTYPNDIAFTSINGEKVLNFGGTGIESTLGLSPMSISTPTISSDQFDLSYGSGLVREPVFGETKTFQSGLVGVGAGGGRGSVFGGAPILPKKRKPRKKKVNSPICYFTTNLSTAQPLSDVQLDYYSTSNSPTTTPLLICYYSTTTLLVPDYGSTTPLLLHYYSTTTVLLGGSVNEESTHPQGSLCRCVSESVSGVNERSLTHSLYHS